MKLQVKDLEASKLEKSRGFTQHNNLVGSASARNIQGHHANSKSLMSTHDLA